MDTIKRIFPVMIFMCVINQATAQDTARNKATVQFFESLKKTYEQALNLGFMVKYTYTDEKNPQKIIDTLTGIYRVSGSSYWFKMAETETMKTDSLIVMLFNEDKMMYVRKAISQSGLDPVEQLKMFLNNNDAVSSKVVKGKKYDELMVSFPEGMDYKSIRLSVDKTTGYLSSSVYIMRTRLLTDNADDNTDGAEAYSEYAKVEATYTNYNNNIVTSLFDEKRFIERKDNKITTTEQYNDYKIFFGSSNL